MSVLMADHRDYADDARQPSLFDVLAPPSARPQQDEPAVQEGGQVVEFPRRREAVEAAAEALVEGESPVAEVPSAYVEPAAPASPEDAWLTEIAPEIDEAELTALAPGAVETDFAPETEVAGEPRTPRVAGASLAGPTLDDVMSRVWEGLALGLPAACPVCHGEVLTAPSGVHSACTSCGTTIE